MEYFVYVLRSVRDGKRYIGISNNVAKRVKQHNNQKVTSTKARTPLTLEYKENCADRKQARIREKYFKTATGRRWLSKLSTCASGGMADTYV